MVSPVAAGGSCSTGTFWVGVYPGITDEMVDYVIEVVHEFVAQPGD